MITVSFEEGKHEFYFNADKAVEVFLAGYSVQTRGKALISRLPDLTVYEISNGVCVWKTYAYHIKEGYNFPMVEFEDLQRGLARVVVAGPFTVEVCD